MSHTPCRRTHLQQIDEFSISRAHLVRVHDFVPAAQLEHILIKLRIRGEIAIREELLALLVIGGKHKSGKDGAKLANLMYDALGLAQAEAKGIDFVRVFGNL
jgi:hypothetical protein